MDLARPREVYDHAREDADMTSPAADRLITGDELARMGDIGRCELVDGRIVRMSPTNYHHGQIEVNFAAALKEWVKVHGRGRVLGGEVGIYTRFNPDRVRGADAAWISDERFARRTVKRAFLDVAPELVVEVLSPDDPKDREIRQKIEEYFAIGVRLVWTADRDEHVVRAYRSLTDVRVFGEADRLSGDDVLPGFDVPVAELLEE